MILRWAWYLTISRLIDLLVVIVVACYLPFFRKGKWGSVKPFNRSINEDELIRRGSEDPVRDNYFVDDYDTHNLLIHVGHGYFHQDQAGRMASQAVTPCGSLYRYVPNDWKGNDPSLDMLAAWVYFYVVCNVKVKDPLERLANAWWKNVMNLHTKERKQSGRCANAGLIWGCNQGWMGLSKPTIGQSYLSGAALLALASNRLGGKWKWRYHFFRLMSFGFFWERYPWLPKTGFVYGYVGHVCQMSLYVIHKCGFDMTKGLRWVAVDNKPLQGIQPFVGGMAADCGVLSKSEILEAKEWLLSQSVTWPQHFHLGSFKPNHKIWSMMALACVQLRKNEYN